MIGRRAVVLGAMALAGCVGGGNARPILRSAAQDPAFLPQPNPRWDAWVEGFRPRALAQGITPATFDAAFRNAGFLPGVIERDRNQTEFTRTTEDYLSIAAGDERLAAGRQAIASWGGVLQQVEGRYGVPANIIAAVWGLESYFGTRRGDINIISATSTLAEEGRRAAFFEQQLVAALRILQAGDTTPDRMVGSWAGAMGHTQFIPTSFLSLAVDFDGDGRRDIWGDDPTDALASAANYLARSGWRQGVPWGLEVMLPSGFDTGLAGRGRGRDAGEWAAMGMRAADGGAIPRAGGASVWLPAGAGGPAFLLFQNFNVILRYNNAENYALGIGHLADRLAGGGPIRGTFPPDATGLTKADRQDLQRLLTEAGFDTEGTDGVIGTKTRTAITAFQRSRGLAQTGEPSRDLLAMLR